MRNIRTTVQKLIAAILTATMLFTCFPITSSAVEPEIKTSASAESATTMPSQSDSTSEMDGSTPSEGSILEQAIVRELSEKREQFTKYYQTEGTAEIAVVSPTPLHFKDAKGEWQDIDNTLIEDTDAKDNDVLINTANAFQVTLPTELEKDTSVDISTKDYTVSFKFMKEMNGTPASAEILQEPEIQNTRGDKFNLQPTTASVNYADVLEEIDIQYDVLPEGVKESIVIKDPSHILEKYEYTIESPGLTAKLLKDNSLAFYNKNGKSEFTMPAPYMFDSAENSDISEKIEVRLEKKSEGVYSLTYLPDMDWFQDDNRVYPITIDPTILYGTEPYRAWVLGIENLDALTKYQLPDIPDGKFVTRAEHMTQIGAGYYDPADRDLVESLSVYKILEDWERPISGIFLTGCPAFAEEPEDEHVFLATEEVLIQTGYSFDVTNLVTDWYESENNYGLVARGNYLGVIMNIQLIIEFDEPQVEISDIVTTPSEPTEDPVMVEVMASCGEIPMQDYSFDGGQTWQTSNSKTFSENAEIEIVARNVNDETAETSFTLDNIDDAPPVISGTETTLDEEENGLTIAVQASDSVSGVQDYSFDNGATWQEENTKHFDEPPISLQVQVRDHFLHVASYSAMMTGFTLSSTEWSNSPIRVNVNASCGTSPITEYSFDDSATWQSVSFKDFAEDAEDVTIIAKAQNGEQCQIRVPQIPFDNTPPEIVGVERKLDEEGELIDIVTATDEGSGVKDYSFDGGLTWQEENVCLVDQPGNSPNVMVRDNLLNCSDPYYFYLKVDQSPNTWTNGDVEVTLTGQNNTSTDMEYSFDGGVTWENTDTTTFTEYEENVDVIAKDMGSVEQTECKVTIPEILIDREQPEIELWSDAFDMNYPTISTKITDAKSEISVVKWAQGEWGSLFFLLFGTVLDIDNDEDQFDGEFDQVYTVYVKDSAGNETIETITPERPTEIDMPLANKETTDPETGEAMLVAEGSIGDDVLEESPLVEEVAEMREESAKIFRREDGVFAAEQYGISIHYEDENGEWKDIDNTLQEDATGYENTAGADNIRISKIPDQDMLTVSTDGTSFSMGLTQANLAGVQVDAENVAGEEEDPNQEEPGIEELVHLESSVKFEEVFEDTDIEYTLIGNEIKELIVVKSAQPSYHYEFPLDMEGLTARQMDPQTVGLFEQDSEPDAEPLYALDATFMVDADGETSEEVTLTLSNGVVTLEADAAWMNAPERVFPIVIDPSIRTDRSKKSIQNSYVASGKPTKNLNHNGFFGVGRESSAGNLRSYIKFDLPAIKSSDTVVGAYLGLGLAKYSGSSPVHAAVYRVTNDWSKKVKTMKWGTKPKTDVNAESTTKISSSGSSPVFDITRLVKSWYEGNFPNYGMELRALNNNLSYFEFVSTNFGVKKYNPMISIFFVSGDGLEGHMSYESTSLGRSGDVNVNLYNGNMVYVHNDISMTGNRLPISVSHVFNNSQKDSKLSSKMSFGKGWRLNVTEQVIDVSKQDYEDNVKYKIIDGDGTAHYYKKKKNSSNVYVNENNDKLELTVRSSSPKYKLEEKVEKANNTTAATGCKEYDANGNLVAFVDTDGNRQTINYSDGRITYIDDPAGRRVSFEYTGNDLTAIKDPAGRKTTYEYSSGRLTEITYPDGKKTRFTYNGSNTAIRGIQAIDGTGVDIGYFGQMPYRVSSLTEKSDNNQTGTRLSFVYNSGNTRVKDKTGKTYTYMFDTAGRTVSVRDNAGNGTFGAYNDKGNKNNTLKFSSEMQRFANNLLDNHSVEKSISQNWTERRDGAPKGTVSVDNKNHMMGKQSLKVKSTGYTGELSYYQTVSPHVRPGKTYTFSAYVKVESIAFSSKLATNGAVLSVSYKDSKGNTSVAHSTPIQNTCGWQRVSVTVTTGKNSSAYLVVRVGLLKAKGVAYFDCMQVEEGAVASSYNMLINPSLDQDTDTQRAVPVGWTGSDNLDPNCFVYNKTCMQIKGNVNQSRYIRQYVNSEGKAGETVCFGGWGRAYAFPQGTDEKKPDSNAIFGFMVQFQDTSVTPAKNSAWTYLPFSAYCKEWQYVAGSAKSPQKFTRIEIRAVFKYNHNVAYFKDIHLYQSEFETKYEYDKDGKLVNTKGANGQGVKYTYDGPNVTKIETKKGSKIVETSTYTYTQKNHIETEISAAGVKQSYAYDAYGNVLATRITTKAGNSGDPNIRVSSSYTANGNYPASSTDARNLKTTVTYNSSTGTLTSTKDPKSSVTTNQYDTKNDHLLSVSGKAMVGSAATQKTVSNAFVYNDDRVTQVKHNGFTYNYTYDTFGRPVSTKVGTATLSTNAYDNNTGLLKKTTYGNTQTMEPVYDSLDRVKQIKYNGKAAYSWAYNNYGLVGYHKDGVSGRSYRYNYDLAQRLSSVQSGNGDIMRYSYDEKGNVKTAKYTVAGKSFTSTYSFGKDNRIGDITANGWMKITRLYDGIGRVKSRAQATGTGNKEVKIKTVYDFVPGSGKNGCNTTGLVSEAKNNFLIGGNDNPYNTNQTYTYEYDKAGNISTHKDGTSKIGYDYDPQGQLIVEMNSITGQNVEYRYDAGGNILQKKVYDYKWMRAANGSYVTTNMPTLRKTIKYTYDPVWKDRLKTYDGQSITYDKIGNPTNYLGMKMTWTQGRRLSTLTKGGVKSVYKYNADGLRTSKKIGNAKQLNYIWEGRKLLCQENGSASNRMIFVYDATGEVSGFTYGSNSTKYMYTKNLQGDVTGIMNSTGHIVARYVYDSWGKLVSIKNESGANVTSASHIGMVNPIRYRSYYYDTETGLYYLQARYYDPEVGRFINADSIAGNTGNSEYNLFAYCSNNPVNNLDSNGEFILTCIIVGFIVGAVVGAASSAITQQATSGTVNWGQVGISALAGGVGGALGGGVGGALSGMAAGTGASALTATSVSLGQAIVIGGTSSVAGGIGSRAVYNSAYNSNASASSQLNYVFSAKAMATDYAIGGLTGGALHIAPRVEIGRITGVRAKTGFPGIRYKTTKGPAYSFEFHSAHKEGHGHPYRHLQVNRWIYQKAGYKGTAYLHSSPWHFPNRDW